MTTVKEKAKQYVIDHPKLHFILTIWRKIIIPAFKYMKYLLHRLAGIFVETDIFYTPTLYNTFIDQIKITTRYRAAAFNIALTENEKQILSLKNAHQGKRAFLVGNGPSLNHCDLTKLENEITFGVNAIYLNKQNFHPRYYIVEDLAVAADRYQEINEYDKPDFKFFGNYLDRYFLNQPKSLMMNVRMNYVDTNRSFFPNFSKNAAVRLWVGGTVSYLGMQLAYYMGINELYLIGFDHNYIIPDSIIQDGVKFTSTENDPNHFDDGYFGKGYSWHDPQVDRMERSYRKAMYYYEKDGRKIYNASVGGKLEVFERIDYKTLF
jgi:hypothetical protein